MPAYPNSPYRDNPAATDNAPASPYGSTQDIPLVQQQMYSTPPLAAANMTDMDRDWDAGQQVQRNDNWLEKGGSKGRSKAMIFGAIGLLLVLGAVGAVVGVLVSRHKSDDSSSSSSSSNSSSSPSDFQKDSRLHQSFYGIAYTPEGSQLAENCGNSLDQVITDIQLLSQLTTRIRLYGADCNQSALVLEAIKQTEVNMTVWLANYVDQDDGGVAYVRQRDLIKEAIQTYGTDHIGGVTVGNEFILDYLDDHDGTSSDTNGALGDAGAELLLVNITDTKAMLSDINIDLPVGTADAGAYMNKILLEHVDYGMANVHPWFADVSIDIAAGWTNTFFQTDDVELAAALNDTPTMYIAETGWPTNSSSTADETNGVSNATVGNLQIFLDDFVCQANTNETKYFFFEYFDEEWKNIEYGGVEGWWGLFHQNRTLKNVVIPDCVLT